MAALQKFKLLAAHCVIIGSPSADESPTTSPVINVRRRVTLRMLLNRPGGSSGVKFQRRREKGSPDRRIHKEGKDNEDDLVVRQKLRDLFELSSPPSSTFDEKIRREGVLSSAGSAGLLLGGGGGISGRGFGLKRKGLTATFRQRMIRRCWKPVLVTIPEEKF